MFWTKQSMRNTSEDSYLNENLELPSTFQIE